MKPLRWTFVVRSKRDPDELTAACGNGKAVWTRVLPEIRWFDTNVDAEIGMEETRLKCAGQSWVRDSQWELVDEPTVTAALSKLAGHLVG